MFDSDVDEAPARKRKIKEISIPNGLENGPVKHKKLKHLMHQKNYFHYIPYVHLLECVVQAKHMPWLI